jgi:hypothetical protein
VAQVFQDLLQRPVDPAGLSFWSGQLDQGATRQQVVLGIEGGQEFRTLTVQGLYQTFLHRTADPLGLSTFVTFLGSGGTVEQVQALLSGSAEYFQTRAGGTNNGFLDAVYQDALHRAVDPSGRAAFAAALASGTSRGDVATAIFSSQEYRQDLVQGFYQHFLHRAADSGGLDFFVGALAAGASDEQVIAMIVSSDEYFERAAGASLNPGAVSEQSFPQGQQAVTVVGQVGAGPRPVGGV